MKPIILGAASVIAMGASVAQAAGDNFDWNGPYIGGNIGLAILDGTISGSEIFSSTASGMSDSSVTIGGVAGWNFLHDNFVFGVEGNFNFLDLGDNIDLSGGKDTANIRVDYDWFATVRGRAGVLVDTDLLVYGTAGIAFMDSDLDVNVAGFSPVSSKKVLTGWTVGAGVEWAFNDSMTAKLEYLYADFGRHRGSAPGLFSTVRGKASPNLHVVQAGINWSFCAGIGC